MFPLSKSLAVAVATIAIGWAVAPVANAAVVEVTYLNAPGDSCQLSLPTIDTVVRPRANGYRNEGSAAKFVICGWGSSEVTSTNHAYLVAMSLDGAPRSMSCTFVAGDTYFPSGLTYITKELVVGSSGNDTFHLDASDFGGSTGNAFPNFNLSVTCNLPPQVAITHLQNRQRVEVGT